MQMSTQWKRGFSIILKIVLISWTPMKASWDPPRNMQTVNHCSRPTRGWENGRGGGVMWAECSGMGAILQSELCRGHVWPYHGARNFRRPGGNDELGMTSAVGLLALRRAGSCTVRVGSDCGGLWIPLEWIQSWDSADLDSNLDCFHSHINLKEIHLPLWIFVLIISTCSIHFSFIEIKLFHLWEIKWLYFSSLGCFF